MKYLDWVLNFNIRNLEQPENKRWNDKSGIGRPPIPIITKIRSQKSFLFFSRRLK